ncbi:uncharacterized protein KIAA1522 homolog [Spea bombifrons]|uniref:uncharacterized protein KIAA1522 homolog n=1 Tax=Spea bombifrons TaxID=233779 RepID=UPI00234B29C6|nr:uncharacterized protein KIAA1522 homolog [Spea bombifrons]
MSTETAPPPDHESVPPVPGPGITEPKKKKHKPGTLRRALSWLRGRRKKKPEAKQQESKAQPKNDGDSQPTTAPGDEPPENVFFPSGSTPFLEDIHNQAQEGLKSLQRREKQNKNNTQDENKSPQTPLDTAENGVSAHSLPSATENTDDAMSVRSEMIQRKGSTFRPHDPPRSPSGRSGRKHRQKRATVVGVPHHIAAELGLQSRSSASHRGIHELFPQADQGMTKLGTCVPVVNGSPGSEQEFVVIPTVDGNQTARPQDGARVSLAALENTEAALQRHINRVYQDDSCIGWKSGPKISPLLLRPKSLAVPGMTTHSSQNDPVGPVMSISPQATYMSKIIPNAVLPPMVDVVALSRSSVRTLSRCSLTTASPASVRGSLLRGRGQSFSSDAWSRSQSTETIVSDSSTISSHGGGHTRETGERHESGLSTGRTSPAPSTGTQDESDAASMCSGRSSIRSVSLRKNKKAPLPPKRTYSLQQQRGMGLPPRPERKPSSKPNHAPDPWVLRTGGMAVENDVFSTALDEVKLNSPSRSDRTLSPSSGYSSQSGTPTLPARALIEYPESPGSRKKIPTKPERTSLVKSIAVDPTTTLSSTEKTSPVLASPPRAGSSMPYQERQDLIPPHPKVPAPLCPPPIKALVGSQKSTPPPSPPPTHHPTPPPARKSESDADVSNSALEETVQKESLWPPPPPEVPDEQDLSMADFPPPADELFLPPPTALEPEGPLTTEQLPVVARDDHDLLAERTSKIITNEEKPLNITNAFMAQPAPVPHFATESSTAQEPPLAKEQSAPSVPLSSDSSKTHLVPSSNIEPPSPAPPGTSTYKPHFITTTSTLTTDINNIEPTVPHVPLDPPDIALKETVSKESSETTVSSSHSVTTVPQSAVVSADCTVPVMPDTTSTRPTPSVWKPVIAPGGSPKKVAAPIQNAALSQKEDANLPIVTPSLLQMVRLRSVQVRGPQVHSTQHSSGLPAPQKPVRKSLSLRSPPGPDSPPGEVPVGSSHLPLKSPDPDPSSHRSSASAASFVFARGSKKFVFEPPASQEAESSLKKDLVTELKSYGGPRSPEGKPPLQKKPSKIPPPVARKPSLGIPRTPNSPQTPNSPLTSTAGSNGSVFTPSSAGPSSQVTGTDVAVTMAGHEQQN